MIRGRCGVVTPASRLFSRSMAARQDITGVGVDLALPDTLTQTAELNGVRDRVT